VSVESKELGVLVLRDLNVTPLAGLQLEPTNLPAVAHIELSPEQFGISVHPQSAQQIPAGTAG
jgi:hypothetical protein